MVRGGWSSVWRPVAAAALGGSILVIAGNSVWAALTASAVNVTPHRVSSGTLALTMAPNGTGFTQAVSNIAPGDTMRRFVDLTNSGTLTGQGLTLSVTATGSNTLIADTADGTRAVRLSVATCSTAWTPTTGTCSGTTTEVLPATPLGTLTTPVTLLPGSVAVNQVHRLQLTLHLPDQNETTVNGLPPATTVQGQSVDVTYRFTETQRSATTTNS